MPLAPVSEPAGSSPGRSAAFVALSAAAILTGLWYLRAELTVAGVFGFPLDDSWIHLQFARNIAAHAQFAFNEGQPSSGSTAPLWTLLLALPLVLGLDPVVSAKCLGISLTAVAACLCWILTKEISGSTRAAYVAGFSLVLLPRMTWASVSGMEVPLYVALCLGAVLAYVRDPDRFAPWWGGLAALAGTSRPETFLFFGVLVIDRTFTRGRGSLAEKTRTVVRAAIPFACVVVLYAVVNMVGGGLPWPSTLAVKSEGQGVTGALLSGRLSGLVRTLVVAPLEALNTFVRFFFDQSAILTMFVLPGALASTGWLGSTHPRARVVLFFAVLPPLILGAMAPTLAVSLQEGRYVAHATAFALVVAVLGVTVLARMAVRSWPVWLVAGFAVVRLLSQDLAFADRHGRMVSNITGMHLEMGDWLARNTPPDAVLAVNDIGAIAWRSGREILDLEGIITPEIIPFRNRGARLEFVEGRRPDFLVIFPEWYPELVERQDLFEEIHRVTVPRVSAAHDTMVVYRTRWADSR